MPEPMITRTDPNARYVLDLRKAYVAADQRGVRRNPRTTPSIREAKTFYTEIEAELWGIDHLGDTQFWIRPTESD